MLFTEKIKQQIAVMSEKNWIYEFLDIPCLRWCCARFQYNIIFHWVNELCKGDILRLQLRYSDIGVPSVYSPLLMSKFGYGVQIIPRSAGTDSVLFYASVPKYGK